MKYTVFTPTYNRAEDLVILYNSLKKQTNKNFEWLIIDDGSTDSTQKKVEEFISEEEVKIKYIVQENGGKHRAFNRAIIEAEGEFFICNDSDDFLINNAIEEIEKFSEIPDNVMAVCFLCKNKKGEIIGNEYLHHNAVENLVNLTFYQKIKGDKLWVFKSSILKKYKFPEIKDEKFITEGILLFEMSLKYDVLVVNRALQIHEYYVGGLTSIGNEKLFKKNPKGARKYYYMMYKVAPLSKYKLYYLYNIIKYSFTRRSI